MKSITEFKLISTVTQAFGIDLSASKTKLEEEVKIKIIGGEVNIEAPSDEEVKEYIKQLDEFEKQLNEGKGELSIPEMEEAQRNANKVAAVINRIALDTYNTKTARLQKDRDNLQGISKKVGSLSGIYDKAINTVKKQRATERIEFVKNWTANELKGRNVYEFAHNFDLYFMQTLQDADGSVNRSKVDNSITSPAKVVKEHILNKINQFETDKKTIESHTHSTVLLEYYIKADYNIGTALDKIAEYIELEQKAKAEAEAKAEADRIRQEQLKAEADRKFIEEQAAQIETAKAEEIQAEELDIFGMDDDVTEIDADEISDAKTETLQDLEHQLYIIEMQDKLDHVAYNDVAAKIAILKGEEPAPVTKTTTAPINTAPQQQVKPYAIKYTLMTEEQPVTKLGQLLKGVNVDVTASVKYSVSIAVERSAGFEEWLHANNIDYVREN